MPARVPSLVVVLSLGLIACQSGASVGATCGSSSDCSSPLVCRLGRCRVECTANRDCPVAARCLLDTEGAGSCSIAPDDACHAGQCPAPTLCIEGRCRNLCGGTTLCPDGNDCVSQPLGDVCIERPVDDAGPSDAATSPDVGIDASIPSAGVIDVCVGERHVCAISAPMGHVYCWGADDIGMLGDGAAAHPECQTASMDACSSVPVAVVRHDDQLAVSGAVELGCGDDHACARLGTGEVYCWGRQFGGNLGTTAYPGVEPLQAVRVEISGAMELLSARSHSCARLGSDWLCWGENGHSGLIDGRLGDPALTGESSDVPRVIPAWHGAERLGLSSWGTCRVIGTDIACVGLNDGGQLGAPPDLLGHPTTPGSLTMPMPVTAIVGGDVSYCTLDATGIATCWGGEDRCATGHDTGAPEVPTPASSIAWRAIFGGVEVFGFCGIRMDDGSVACWGQSGYGEAGMIATATCAPAPISRDDGTPLLADDLALGGVYCAIDPSRALWCWGAGGTMLQQPVGATTPATRAIHLSVPE